MHHALEILLDVIAWIAAVAITVGVTWALLKILRLVLKDSKGKPKLRAAMLFGYVAGLFALWSASRVVP